VNESRGNAGVQTFYNTGMKIWIGDEANGIGIAKKPSGRRI
jgi:hypothetical protein